MNEGLTSLPTACNVTVWEHYIFQYDIFIYKSNITQYNDLSDVATEKIQITFHIKIINQYDFYDISKSYGQTRWPIFIFHPQLNSWPLYMLDHFGKT